MQHPSASGVRFPSDHTVVPFLPLTVTSSGGGSCCSRRSGCTFLHRRSIGLPVNFAIGGQRQSSAAVSAEHISREHGLPRCVHLKGPILFVRVSAFRHQALRQFKQPCVVTVISIFPCLLSLLVIWFPPLR